MRKSLSKRVRFDVFKRDAFTCQYCGSQPPNVLLVIDHILPIAEGGTDDFDNLTTACETCNQGKAAKRLDRVPNRPDADLLRLQAAQDLEELKRFQEVKSRLQKERQQTIEYLQEIWWRAVSLDWCPSDKLLAQMLNKYSVHRVAEAVEVVAPKVDGKYLRGDSWIPYMWGVLRKLQADAEAEAEEMYGWGDDAE